MIMRPAGRSAGILLVVLISIAVYANTLWNGFVYDDTVQILENPWIRDLRYLPDILGSDVWGFLKDPGLSKHYRPLLNLIYSLDYRLFGLNPSGFHLTNMLLHAGASSLVFLVALALSGSRRTAFIAGILFAAHPVHTEAVAWVACISETSLAVFYLLSFLLYIKEKPALSGAAFFLALLSKEVALTLPAVLIAYDLSLRGKPFRERFSERYLPHILAAGAYFAMRVYATGLTPGFIPKHAELTVWQYFINALLLFAGYLSKLILPIGLNAYHALNPVYSITEPRGIMSVLVLAGFTAAAIICRKRNRAFFISLALIAAPLLPVLYIPAMGENSFAERYLYLPSAGYVIILAVFLERLRGLPFKKAGYAVSAIFILIVLLYSASAVKRNTAWRSDITLWEDAVGKSPDHHVPHSELAFSYEMEGRLDEAVEHYKISLSMNPLHVIGHNRLGMIYLKQGLPDLAIEHFDYAIALKPDVPVYYYNMASALRRKGWGLRAEEYENKAKEMEKR